MKTADCLSVSRSVTASRIVALLFLALAGSPTSCFSADDQVRQWAIISDEASKKFGFSDLLFAELARENEFRLVERDRIAAVIRELELGNSTTVADVQQALKVGQMAGADRVIILRHRESNEIQTVRVVVCDCDQGVRLSTHHVSAAMDELGSSAEEVVSHIQAIRARFADGIITIIAVPPFVSHCLVQDYDGMQSGCAALLGETLQTADGVALVELREAQVLRREITSLTGAASERAVPLAVHGEFKVPPDGGRNTIDVSVVIRDGSGVRKQNDYSVPISEIGELLRRKIADDVLRIADAQDAELISPNRQIALLKNRAATLDSIGAYENAVGLHEAIFLLRPDDARQRLLAIESHYSLMHAIRHEARKRSQEKEVEQTPTQSAERRVACLTSIGRHLEYLINNRKVSLRDARNGITKIIWNT